MISIDRAGSVTKMKLVSVHMVTFSPVSETTFLKTKVLTRPIKRTSLARIFRFSLFKDGACYCYCAYVLRISRYSDFLWVVLMNSGIFLLG